MDGNGKKQCGGNQGPINFEDLSETLSESAALSEANRCLYCYDPPCAKACHTGIDVPGFIRKISTGNIRGAALKVLESNIMGGTCSRVCPVETLCENVCVRKLEGTRPVSISALQRFAVDYMLKRGENPFRRNRETGKHVAVVGAGPAGLSCAHRLSRLGHEVTVFEARPKPGGLNEYGLAPYKISREFVQKEIDFILSLGGIEVKCGMAFGRDFTLRELRKKYDAVFLGIGLGGVNTLQTEGEHLPGVLDAIQFISHVRQVKDLREVRIGKKVLVIGGGSTAVDVAVQAKMLGAQEVTLVYRRGKEQMRATEAEQEFAQVNGVYIRYWAKPRQILGGEKGVRAVEFEKTQYDCQGLLCGTGERFSLEADMVFKAIGQVLLPSHMREGFEMLNIENGQIVVDGSKETSLYKVFAGGDCTNGGKFTVTAVEDGKIAALAIHQKLLDVNPEEGVHHG